MGKNLFVVVLYHLVLRLLLPDSPLQIVDPQLNCLLAEPIRFGVFIIFESFDIDVDAVLGLDVFHVSAVKINAGLLFNDFSLLESYLAMVFLNLHVGQSHLLVQILDFILYFIDILLKLLLPLESSHNKIGELL